MMFLNTGYMKPQLMAVKLGGSGNIAESQVAWKQSAAVPNKPSPLLVDDQFYMVSDGGVASCLDAKVENPSGPAASAAAFSASPSMRPGVDLRQ
jgi:hypothetical protein